MAYYTEADGLKFLERMALALEKISDAVLSTKPVPTPVGPKPPSKAPTPGPTLPSAPQPITNPGPFKASVVEITGASAPKTSE